MEKFYNKLERTIGGLKFAVVIIVIFSILMIIGTFMESYFGTDFANRVVYKTPYFIFIQFLMFLSILAATLIRLPIKKRLHGFYVIHAGLIIIGIGSVVTYVAGIDGTIHLNPMSPNREVVLNDDVIEIHAPEAGKRASLKLPYTAFPTDIGAQYEEIKITEFLPYAEKKLTWVTAKEENISGAHSSEYLITNPNVTQDFILSLHPEAFDFQSTLAMGLLEITYLPSKMYECFTKENPTKLILWDTKRNECSTIDELGVKIQKTKTGKRFFAFKAGSQVYSFLPDLSPWALDEQLKPIMNASVKVFSKNLFEKKPHLFLFGESLSYYDKENDQWIAKKFDKDNKAELPWMGFELELLRHETNVVPTYVPIKTWPVQKSGRLIKGDLKAVKLIVRDSEYWLTSERPVTLMIDGVKMNIYLTKESHTLPFEFTLTKFKMDTNPGTKTPASYESFVNLFTPSGTTNHHIFMNNPLKHDGFTFYQASYSKDEQTGQYSSTLSVNVDQGRPLKYFGSLLLVLGSWWHFVLNARARRKESDLLGLDEAGEKDA
jgi:hypothetical protein